MFISFQLLNEMVNCLELGTLTLVFRLYSSEPRHFQIFKFSHFQIDLQRYSKTKRIQLRSLVRCK